MLKFFSVSARGRKREKKSDVEVSEFERIKMLIKIVVIVLTV